MVVAFMSCESSHITRGIKSKGNEIYCCVNAALAFILRAWKGQVMYTIAMFPLINVHYLL